VAVLKVRLTEMSWQCDMIGTKTITQNSGFRPANVLPRKRVPVSSRTDLSDCSDEDLLNELRRGNREAFGQLVRRYERELYGYLRRYLSDASLAEDVFQNTFLQVFVKSSQYESGRPVRPWLYTIATNQAIDAMRRNGRHTAVSLDEQRADPGEGELARLLEMLQSRGPSPVESATAQERREQVRAGVEKLPDFLRQVLLLAYYQGLKYREIADILEIPVGTVKSRLHAALVKLQETWADTPSLHEV
jgi:RNA polymerase sigma-70 factor, ECF subfamily